MKWKIIRPKMKGKIRVNNFKTPDNISGKSSDNPSDNPNDNPSEKPKDRNSYIYYGRLGHDAARVSGRIFNKQFVVFIISSNL